MPEFWHRFTLLAMCVVLAALLASGFPSGVQAKPIPPFSVTWERQQEDGLIRLILTVTSRIPLPRTEVTVSADEGVVLDGVPHWTGPMAVGERRIMVFRVPESATGTVTARVDVRTALNVHFTAGTAIHVPNDPPIHPHLERHGRTAPSDPPRRFSPE